MESKYPAGEWVVIAIALAIFFVYHGWFFLMKTGCARAREDKYYGELLHCMVTLEWQLGHLHQHDRLWLNSGIYPE